MSFIFDYPILIPPTWIHRSFFQSSKCCIHVSFVTASRRYSRKSRVKKNSHSNSACPALFYRGWYESMPGFFISLLVAHLECSMWLCHMLSRAHRPWLSATLKSAKRDPILHFPKIKEKRRKSLARVKRGEREFVHPAWRSPRFTPPCSVYKGCPRKLYVWLASEQTNGMCTQWQG